MQRWPWPQEQVGYFIGRAVKALGRDDRAEIVAALAALAVRGDIRDLRAWARNKPPAELAELITATAKARPDAHKRAVRETGMRRGRGDLVRIRGKARPAWWDLRTH